MRVGYELIKATPSLGFLIGFILDRPINRIGTIGWDMIQQQIDKGHDMYAPAMEKIRNL